MNPNLLYHPFGMCNGNNQQDIQPAELILPMKPLSTAKSTPVD
jgi:hypothetical protein